MKNKEKLSRCCKKSCQQE